MAGLAASSGLVLFIGSSFLPVSQLEIDYYVKKRVVDAGLPLRQMAERLARRDLPYRDELAAALSTRVANPEDAAAIPALAALLADDDLRVRRAAVFALRKVFDSSVNQSLEEKVDGPSRARLLAAQSDADALVRQVAAQIVRSRPGMAAALPSDPGAATINGLLESLESGDAMRRHQALHALRTMGPAAGAAVPALLNHLSVRDPGERLMVALTLSYVDPSSSAAIGALSSALTQPYMPAARMQAARRLGELGPAAKESVPQFLEAWEKRMLTIEEASELHRIDSQAAADARIPPRSAGGRAPQGGGR
jgi:hypothetical protein